MKTGTNKALLTILILLLNGCGEVGSISQPVKRIFVEKENNLWNSIKNILNQRLCPEGYFETLPQENIDQKFEGSNLLHLLVSYEDRQKDYEVVVNRIKLERLIEKNNDGKTPYVLAYMKGNLEFYDIMLKKIEKENLVSTELLEKLKIIQTANLNGDNFTKSSPMLLALTGADNQQFDLAFSLADMMLKDNEKAKSNFNSYGGESNSFSQIYHYALNVVDTSGKGDTSLSKLYNVCKNKNDPSLLKKIEDLLQKKIEISENEYIYLCDVSLSYDVAGKLSSPFILKVVRNKDWSLLDKCLDILLSYKGKILLLQKAVDEKSVDRKINLLNKCLENIETRNVFRTNDKAETLLGKICENANNDPNDQLNVRLLKKATKVGFNFL
jgi:hypothetical protein